ncbi:MAG TPA: TatD family hydrolase [Acidimicrobiales bacterium]|nr:TatD family hydrolase [Acidimicrobiales bacterium]
MTWTDSHCHVSYDGVGVDAVARAHAAGVTRVVSVGTDVAKSAATIGDARLCRAAGFPVWATAGLHPHDATDGLDGLEALLDEPEVVAVGECGLDYYYEHSPREVQLEVFAAQVELARRHDLALVVHTRDAWEDTFAVLDATGVPDRTVIHCFSGGPDEARGCLDRGAALSFSGIVTFKNAEPVREAAALCPLDRLLVETDAPFLAPVPHRGATNEPAWVALVGERLASVRGVPTAVVEAATWANTERLFGLG